MYTQENFDIWNEEKKLIHVSCLPQFYVNAREIWYVKLWVNVWFEQNGKSEYKRPVLVVKKVGNLFFVVPLTTHWKNDSIFYYLLKNVTFKEKNKVARSFCILSQGKVLDKRRFLHKIWEIGEQESLIIKKKLKEILL